MTRTPRARRQKPRKRTPTPATNPAQSLAVAYRSTLRALPTLFHEGTYQYDAAERNKLVLVSWRTLSAIWLSVRVGREHSALGFVARAVAMSGDRILDPTALLFSDALFDTLQTSIDVNNANLHAREAIEAGASACNSATPMHNAGSAASGAASQDIRLLNAGLSPDSLILMPAWHDGVPAWHAALWETARRDLLSRDEHWQVWLEWYESRLRGESGLAQLEIARVTEVADADWQNGAKAANEKILRIIERYSPKQEIEALAEAENDNNSPPVTAVGDQLQFTNAAHQDDNAVAARAGMAAEYANIRALVRELKTQVSTWVDKDCHPDWSGLKGDVVRLSKRLPPDIHDATKQISVVWASGLAVAEYLDQDRQLRVNPNSGNAPTLPLPLRNKLTTFVQAFGAWLLDFPTVRQREENAHAFTSAIERLNSAKEITAHIRSTASLRIADLELLEELLRAGGGVGPQAAKARFWSLSTVKRLLFAGGKILATAAARGVAEDVVESSVLLGRLKKFMLQGESAISSFVTDLPSASREALLAVIERIREGSGGTN